MELFTYIIKFLVFKKRMRWSKTKFHWSLQTVLSYRKKLNYLRLLSRNLGVAPQDHVDKRINSVHLWINFLWDITLLWIMHQVSSALLSLHPKLFRVITPRFVLLARVLYTVLLCSDELKFFADEIINPEGWARNFTQVYQGFYFAVKWGYRKKPDRCFLHASISYLGMLWPHISQGRLSPLSIWWGTLVSVFTGDALASNFTFANPAFQDSTPLWNK